MRSSLFSKEVITMIEKEELDKVMTGQEQMGKVIDIIISSLKTEQTVKYKRFLEVMESNEDIVLNWIAKRYGEYA